MKDRFSKVTNHAAFPISILVIISLIAGIFTFQDYGMSWDEPLFYKYADAIPYAYSVTARLSGDFNILKAYGPSETDHMMYGPAYLLIARPFVLLTKDIFDSDLPTAWHLINFILFNIGAIFIYLLALRWMNRWAAFSGVLLFITQPLLWGHAFINPKDIPFTAFFIIAIYAGYRMVDKATLPQQNNKCLDSHPRFWKWFRIILWIIFTILFFTTISIIVFDTQIRNGIPGLIRYVYNTPDSLSGKIFLLLTNNPSGSNQDAYILKATNIFRRIPLLIVLITVTTGIITFLASFKTNFLQRIFQSINLDLPGRETALAGTSLGILTAIRILGPFAGVLVSLFYLFKFGRRAIHGIIIYGLIAFMTMFIFWPYLWHSPIGGFIAVLKHMADNPQIVPVLFNGQAISSNTLPASYLPTMLGLTLTEPVWILFIVGSGILVYLLLKNKLEFREICPIYLWFLLPFLYVLINKPPQYDGFRHFTFILPPVFIVTGFVFNKFYKINPIKWINPVFILLLAVPGIIGIIRLHPYEYTYYNSIIGGTKGAFRKFETDYWLTCYKEAIDQLNNSSDNQRKLFVYKNKYLASQYSGEHFILEQFEPNLDTTSSGDLLLMSTRSNKDLEFHRDDPIMFSITRNGAIFCSMKTIK